MMTKEFNNEADRAAARVLGLTAGEFYNMSEAERETELFLSSCEQDDFVGLRGTPTGDGGMLIEVGRDPAGEAVVDIMPMFMEKVGDFATAIETKYMGVYGEAKVPSGDLGAIYKHRGEFIEALDVLYQVNRNWPIMLVVRALEHIAEFEQFPDGHNRRNAANSLADAANALIDRLEG